MRRSFAYRLGVFCARVRYWYWEPLDVSAAEVEDIHHTRSLVAL